MYPKLQSQGLAGGPNTGSCAAYAYYLEHENLWKKDNDHRKDIIPFYDQDGNAVSVGTAIRAAALPHENARALDRGLVGRAVRRHGMLPQRRGVVG